ncbi:sensor cyclic diguanylate phosphodiesterase, HAMP and GAF domain-containing, putative heme-binding site [Geotalea daltonii FRC-32]|uniref:Sensor cyclic diguanylate phosphodiesterase, HAMP and GAF domain-containing, putative heme-binding site n=1 Tax=Geotalea daltonii (strain DSM 22248 / JCM 15807 / FRC-32) TaxID=316067 RepID=B9M5N8_GEODF|nr:HD domain-containing phosphohydrolase [Geotalea daltonii]ACM21797.1 sensor cyclic diguanylate phosphodiesterase, HAMP and GAF domain-containing, putative heme-binding site [Geotalea daltonii FRC-32]
MINSLKIKIIGLVTVTIIGIVSLVSYVTYRQQKEMLYDMATYNTNVLNETVKNSISDAMRSGRSQEISAIFSRLRSKEFISSLRIVDETGKILISADQTEIGHFLPEYERHELKTNFQQKFTLSENRRVFDSFARIPNNPLCHRCHSPSIKTLGFLETELSMGYMERFLEKEKRTAAISTVLIIGLIIIMVSVFLIFYVDKPIRKLISTMEEVEKGNFDHRTIISSSNEMRILSQSFNRMVERFRDMMEANIVHERELARAQEKLSHHRETHLMNQKLEEQIKEIETLNVNLEERIEEIEEANYKIADLAGELEDKNTTLENAVSKLSTLYKVGLAINSTMESESLFKLIVKTTMDTLRAQIGYIILWDQEQHEMLITTLIGHDGLSPSGTVLPRKQSSVSSWVIENGKPLLIADINQAPEFDRFSAMGYERKTLICAPLIVKNEIIGTITVVNKIDNSTYNHEELELFSTIAAQASIAIKNAKLYDEQQKTYLNTIQALVSAIEASDSYTRGHSERVTYYSLELAKKLELPQDRLKIIERAAILHDIGKIGIDLTLLHKEGRLTAEDINDLQQHPTIGMKILEPIEFLQDVRLCIGQHHERYDGQGYPNSIPASGLLLESKILAIADAFDAMTSDRPYRKALPVEVAINELYSNAGTQFDPELVPHFVDLLKDSQFQSSRVGRATAMA